MFNKSKKVSSESSMVSATMTINGDITSAGDLFLSGVVIGNVQTEGSIIATKGSRIEGNLSATGKIIISGEVLGNIESTSLVSISATGNVTGNIKSKSLQLEDGAYLSGNCSMDLPLSLVVVKEVSITNKKEASLVESLYNPSQLG
jgi:cytoskeletal protein CcmA (bactofilin family)